MSPRTVLVVEDDASIALGLRINLEKEGYRVLAADNGEQALEMVRSAPPDLLILDVMLPRMNGLEVLEALRRDGFGMPVIILSARTGEMDKVAGLELGAEDYVSKPFSLAELLARVRAALRRGPIQRVADVVTCGQLRIDADARNVTLAGSPVDMTTTEFDVMMCLVRAAGRVVPRDEIFRTVWGPSHHGTPRTIDNFVQQLRSKLEPEGAGIQYFHTVRGIGYRFAYRP